MSCGSMTAQAFDQKRCVSTMCADEDGSEIEKRGDVRATAHRGDTCINFSMSSASRSVVYVIRGCQSSAVSQERGQ